MINAQRHTEMYAEIELHVDDIHSTLKEIRSDGEVGCDLAKLSTELERRTWRQS